MLERFSAVLPVFFLVQTAVVHWAARYEHPPIVPDLAAFPSHLGAWHETSDDPSANTTAADLHADRLLGRTYANTSASASAELFVAWFQSQRGGMSQPHSPKVCLPGAGWVPEATSELTVETSAGTILVNRYVISRGNLRGVVLYWYQTPRRCLIGEWQAKFWLAVDLLRDRRTDTAMVRIIVWSGSGGDTIATTTATQFAQVLYPMLRNHLPR